MRVLVSTNQKRRPNGGNFVITCNIKQRISLNICVTTRCFEENCTIEFAVFPAFCSVITVNSYNIQVLGQQSVRRKLLMSKEEPVCILSITVERKLSIGRLNALVNKCKEHRLRYSHSKGL